MRLDLYPNAKPLPQEKVRILHDKYMAGDQRALHELVEANAGLAYKITIYYYEKSKRNRRVEGDDLLQAAFEGLTRGCQDFRPSKGFKISTYVAFWIRKYVMREVYYQHYRVRPPKPMADKFFIGDMTQERIDWYMSSFINCPNVADSYDDMIDPDANVDDLVIYDLLLETAGIVLNGDKLKAFLLHAGGSSNKEITAELGKDAPELISEGIRIVRQHMGVLS